MKNTAQQKSVSGGGRRGRPPHSRTRPSERENCLLRMVAASINADGTQPSLRDIARDMGYVSVGYVHVMVRNLQKKGIVATGRHARHGLSFNWKEYL